MALFFVVFMDGRRGGAVRQSKVRQNRRTHFSAAGRGLENDILIVVLLDPQETYHVYSRVRLDGTLQGRCFCRVALGVMAHRRATETVFFC